MLIQSEITKRIEIGLYSDIYWAYIFLQSYGCFWEMDKRYML